MLSYFFFFVSLLDTNCNIILLFLALIMFLNVCRCNLAPDALDNVFNYINAPFASTKSKFVSLFLSAISARAGSYIPGQTGKFSIVLSIAPNADFNIFS